MSTRFEELDWRPTAMGVISLRRRFDPALDQDVYEIKLDDDFLMSSAFTAAEIEMARLALAALPAKPLDVAVGGLGLGYTALEVLADRNVRSLVVNDALAEVIEWHQQGLIPAGVELSADPRCRLVHGDFFSLVDAPDGLDPQNPGRRFHAIIVDIDHSPRHLLNPRHAPFYEPAGLHQLANLLQPDGIFALWSNDPPDEDFLETLGAVFPDPRAEVVSFPNPLQDQDATNTVYLASKTRPDPPFSAAATAFVVT